MADSHKIGQIDQDVAEIRENVDNTKRLRTDLNDDLISPESNKTKKLKLISKYFPTNVEIPTEPCTNINNMNDDCLLELFRGKFTLQQLMHLRRVCVLWQMLIEQLFAGKRFLKIFITKNVFVKHFRAINQMAEQARMEKDDEEGLFTLKSDSNGVDDVLVIKNLKHLSNQSLNLTFVSTLFPSVTNLLIVFPQNCHPCPSKDYHCHIHFGLCDMLAQWPKLSSLSLKDISIPTDKNFTSNMNSYGESNYNCYYHWFGKEFERLLWPALPQLSSVHLFGKNVDIENFPVQIVLKRLKRFSIVSKRQVVPKQAQPHDRHAVELLPHLKRCTRLISLGLNGLLCDKCFNSGKKEKQRTNFYDNLTHLTFAEDNKFFAYYKKFKALTYLDINLVKQFQKLTKSLAKLTNLTELRIKLGGLVDMSDQQSTNLLTIRLDQPIPVLSSVKILHLRIFQSYILLKESPTDRRLDPTFLKALPHIFPNLKTVKLIAISQIVKTELEICFKSRGPSHFPLLMSVEFLPFEAEQIDLAKYNGPYRELLKSDKSDVKEVFHYSETYSLRCGKR